MAGLIGKRKREQSAAQPSAFKKPRATTSATAVNGKNAAILDPETSNAPKSAAKSNGSAQNGHVETRSSTDITIQVVTGSYERVLHGFTATIPKKSVLVTSPLSEDSSPVKYADTFLFAAHTSSIRTLALSPATQNNKRFLATGGADERINLYNLSTLAPSTASTPRFPSLSRSKIAENVSNQALGNLIHHDRAISCLHFASKSKLFSAAEENTIGITRTRDWTLLSTLKAPIPKPAGRPSGDTAAPGEVPTGINDFAIHPSEKLMLSVSRGERCMRLWNLMTGKKAGVLNFTREMLGKVGEGKYSSGEGRRVCWTPDGGSYVVAFERGVVLFTLESEVVDVVVVEPRTKVHQMRFLPGLYGRSVLAISTEDGRVVLYELASPSTPASDGTNGNSLPATVKLALKPLAQIGGKAAGISGRIRDFEVLPLPAPSTDHLLITASSDGAVRFWKLSQASLAPTEEDSQDLRQVGTLISTHETGNRITCLGAFVMDARGNGDGDGAANGDEGETSEEEEVAMPLLRYLEEVSRALYLGRDSTKLAWAGFPFYGTLQRAACCTSDQQAAATEHGAELSKIQHVYSAH
ncbi:Protein mak11 [Oleoguttula sp. CCFEE 5521]